MTNLYSVYPSSRGHLTNGQPCRPPALPSCHQSPCKLPEQARHLPPGTKSSPDSNPDGPRPSPTWDGPASRPPRSVSPPVPSPVCRVARSRSQGASNASYLERADRNTTAGAVPAAPAARYAYELEQGPGHSGPRSWWIGTSIRIVMVDTSSLVQHCPELFCIAKRLF